MERTKELLLRLPETNGHLGGGPSSSTLARPSKRLRRDLTRVDENTALHIAAMQAHKRKGLVYEEILEEMSRKSAETFKAYAASSEARIREARGMMFEEDIELAEHFFRQHCFDALAANAQQVARGTGRLAAMSVLPPPEEQKKGFWQKLFGS